MKRTLCLWFPNWPIQRLVVEQPTLRKTHLVLFRRDSRKGQLVAAASPLAMQQGVDLEMPVSEVKQLLRHSGRKQNVYRPSHQLHPRTQYHQLARQGDIGFRGRSSQKGHSTTGSSGDTDITLPLGESDDAAPKRQHSAGEGNSSHVSQSVRKNSSGLGASPRQKRESIEGPGLEPKRLEDTDPKANDSAKDDAFYILEHDPVADRHTLENVVDLLHDFSPIVGIEQTDAPESCFLDVTGLGSLFGDEQSLRTEVIRFLQTAGYMVFSALADTPGMAWGLAHYHRSAAPSPQSSSATNQISAAREFPQLPIAALRLAARTRETFHRLGIERVEQILAIPRAHLASRFGDEVSKRIDQALGKVVEPIVARHQPAEFEASQFIEFPTRDRETIGVVLSRSLEQICEQLQSKQKGALQWQVRLYCVDAPSIEFQVNLFQPTATVDHVLQLMELQLETVLKPHLRRKRLPRKGNAKNQRVKHSIARTVTQVLIQEITVRVTSCVLLVQRQRELFDESPRLDKRELAHLVNHLASRLGQQSIVYPVLQSGAQPEFSFRFKSLIDPSRMRSRKRERVKSRSHTLARPLRLLDPPLLIAESDALPCRFRHQKSIHCVSRQWGPERIETGWWHGPTLRRDYWRVETAKGLHFWIYRDLKDGRWFLQGEF